MGVYVDPLFQSSNVSNRDRPRFMLSAFLPHGTNVENLGASLGRIEVVVERGGSISRLSQIRPFSNLLSETIRAVK